MCRHIPDESRRENSVKFPGRTIDKAILNKYMQDASEDFVSRFVRQKAQETGLSDEGISYITSFYSYAIVGITMQWVENGMPEYRKNLLRTVSETYEATIDVMIKDYISHNIK